MYLTSREILTADIGPAMAERGASFLANEPESGVHVRFRRAGRAFEGRGGPMTALNPAP